jgi:hypothetical protein
LSKLKAIAARYAAGLSASETLTPLADEQRLHVMRCLMRYGLVWNHLNTVISLGHKTREEMSDDEWLEFRTSSVAFFNSNLRDFGSEAGMSSYIRTRMAWLFPEAPRVKKGVWMCLPESELPKIMAWFVTLSDAAEYGY